MTRRELLAFTRPERSPEDATIRSYGFLPRVRDDCQDLEASAKHCRGMPR